MTPLLDELAITPTEEIEATRRLLHRAGATRRRLGVYRPGRLLEDAWPGLLAATCLELGAELDRRGVGLGACPACAAALGRSVDSAVTAESRAS